MVRRGSILFELLVAMMILGLLAASVAAIYRAQATAVLMLYEERVAWEAATARLEILESGGWKDLREGRSEIAVDSPGWENLQDARCVLVVGPPGRVTVEVSWEGTRGGRRLVEATTRIGAAR